MTSNKSNFLPAHFRKDAKNGMAMARVRSSGSLKSASSLKSDGSKKKRGVKRNVSFSEAKPHMLRIDSVKNLLADMGDMDMSSSGNDLLGGGGGGSRRGGLTRGGDAVPQKNTLSKGARDIHDVWYSHAELENAKQDAAQVLELIDNPALVQKLGIENVEDELDMRGLERQTEEGSWQHINDKLYETIMNGLYNWN